MDMRLSAPCLFGLEGVLSKELRRLGARDIRAEDGRVFFMGDMQDLVRANLWLRTAERVGIVLCDAEARTFDELFELVKAAPLEAFIPKDGAFPVKGHCLDSALMSVPDCQRIIKKAAAVRLGSAHGLERLPETGALYQITFLIRGNRALITLDTSGAGLHKRGYRARSLEAPLRETIAAGMVLLSRYRGRDTFFDPFCGSGTIPIEAALIARNRAPGLKRRFAFEAWREGNPAALLREEREAARAAEYSGPYDIRGGDSDASAISLAILNAKEAGVLEHVRFEEADARDFRPEPGLVVSNPPYGLRMLDEKAASALVRDFGARLARAEGMKLFMLSADPEFERAFGRPAAKRRKLYNGMIRCTLYMYG